MSRADRRRIARNQTKELENIEKATREEKKLQLYRNGITAEDLKKNYDIGFEDGVKVGQQTTINMVYAAVCLSLKELHGFSTKRCHRILSRSYQHIINTIDNESIIKRVMDEMGIEIRLDDPIDPIGLVDKEAG